MKERPECSRNPAEGHPRRGFSRLGPVRSASMHFIARGSRSRAWRRPGSGRAEAGSAPGALLPRRQDVSLVARPCLLVARRSSTTSSQVPRSPPLARPWPRRLLSPLLGPEAADAVEVVAGDREAEERRHLGQSEHPEEAPGEVSERTLEGGVGRLDDLAASHRATPGGGAEGDALPPRQLRRHHGQGAGAAPLAARHRL